MTGDWLLFPGLVFRILIATTTGLLLTGFIFTPYTSIVSSASTFITEYPVGFSGRRIKLSSPVIELASWEQHKLALAKQEGEADAAPSITNAVLPALAVTTVTQTVTAAHSESTATGSLTSQLTLPIEAQHDSEFFLKHNVVGLFQL